MTQEEIDLLVDPSHLEQVVRSVGQSASLIVQDAETIMDFNSWNQFQRRSS